MSVSIHGISYLKVVELLQGAHNFKIYPFPIFFGLLYIWNLLLFCSYVNIQYDSINNKHHDINLTGIIIIIIMLLFFFYFHNLSRIPERLIFNHLQQKDNIVSPPIIFI